MTEESGYKFYIYFFGLICHMGDDVGKYYAALVRDEHHSPSILYGKDGDHEPETIPIGNTTESVKFVIDDEVTEDEARVTKSFRRFVPSLQALMGGSPRIDIKHYAIPVYYPAMGGEKPDLDVFLLYKGRAWYHHFGVELRKPEFVARLTGVEIDVGSPRHQLRVVQIRQDETPLSTKPIYPNSCVVIANAPEMHEHHGESHGTRYSADHESSDVEGHVMRYGQILIGHDSIVNVLQPDHQVLNLSKSPHCPWIERWLGRCYASTTVECGNTGWP